MDLEGSSKNSTFYTKVQGGERKTDRGIEWKLQLKGGGRDSEVHTHDMIKVTGS